MTKEIGKVAEDTGEAMLPEDADHRRMFDHDVTTWGSPLLAIAIALELEWKMLGREGSKALNCAIYANELRKADAAMRRVSQTGKGDEIAWVAEVSPNGHYPPTYYVSGAFRDQSYSTDPSLAMRFVRRTDVETAIKTLRMVSCVPREHCWPAPPPAVEGDAATPDTRKGNENGKDVRNNDASGGAVGRDLRAGRLHTLSATPPASAGEIDNLVATLRVQARVAANPHRGTCAEDFIEWKAADLIDRLRSRTAVE